MINMLSLNRLKLAAVVASLGVAVLTTVAHANPSYYRARSNYSGNFGGGPREWWNWTPGLLKIEAVILVVFSWEVPAMVGLI